jgi:hypothetical protein
MKAFKKVFFLYFLYLFVKKRSSMSLLSTKKLRKTSNFSQINDNNFATHRRFQSDRIDLKNTRKTHEKNLKKNI